MDLHHWPGPMKEAGSCNPNILLKFPNLGTRSFAFLFITM